MNPIKIVEIGMSRIHMSKFAYVRARKIFVQKNTKDLE